MYIVKSLENKEKQGKSITYNSEAIMANTVGLSFQSGLFVYL